MKLTTQILNWIDFIRNRPSMVIGHQINEINYTTVCTYIDGYLDGIGHALNIELTHNICRWYEKQIRTLISCGLSNYVKYKNKSKPDTVITDKLLDIIESFFLQNPNWERENIAREHIEYYLGE